MSYNLTEKIIASHLAKPSSMQPGEEIYLKIDQTLTHDINAVMSYLAFEGIGIPRVRTECSVSYLDHNLLYIDNKTPDDHIFLQSIAKRYGIFLSRSGNGIMHSVHYARFGVPGKTSMGTDSHTSSGGAIGMFSIGAGGMDTAGAMAGFPMRLKMPEVIHIYLTGRLHAGCNAKDVILKILKKYTVKGGLGKVFEYTGPGVSTLEVPERATIANMGTEMGSTTSVFPADEIVLRFFRAQGREKDFRELYPDKDCHYSEEYTVDLSEIEPMIACPNSPDNVMPVKKVEKIPVNQVFIGSCTNASYADIAKAALIFRGRHVNDLVSCTCGISTRQIYKSLLRDGYIDMLVDAGVRLLEISCGPCCAIGQVPQTDGVSLRTSNRNFKGRSGNPNALLYLASPETAASSAITGTFTTAEEIMGNKVNILATVHEPENYPLDDSMIIKPSNEADAAKIQIIRGPNIQPLPVPSPPEEQLIAQVSLKGGDNITTDDITPASAEFSSMRSNIPMLSRYCYCRYDPGFTARTVKMKKSIIIAGENYGQGSSREHAAICPMYLGVKAIIAKSIARIHKNNLINHDIVPLIFENPSDYESISLGDTLEIDHFPAQIKSREITVKNLTAGVSFSVKTDLSNDEVKIVLAGGQLNFMRNHAKSHPVIH